MGVKGLWPLLEPVGRRISIEALQNKRLAVGERRPRHAPRLPRALLPPKLIRLPASPGP